MDRSLKIITGYNLTVEPRREIALPKFHSTKLHRVLVRINQRIGAKLSIRQWSMIVSFAVFFFGFTFASVLTMLVGAVLMAAVLHQSMKGGGA